MDEIRLEDELDGWTEDSADPQLESMMAEFYGMQDDDYGPSNPWDAPGMSVSDFISGVRW